MTRAVIVLLKAITLLKHLLSRKTQPFFLSYIKLLEAGLVK